MEQIDKVVQPAPGYYDAKILNYGIKKTKAGDPAPTIAFEVEVRGGKHKVFWQGSLKDGPARDISLKALMVCGFTNPNAFPYLANGIESGLLDLTKEVQVTVEHETVEEVDDKTGQTITKKYPRVRWINESGGGKFKNAIDVSEAAILMSTMGLEADFFRIANESGVKMTNKMPDRTQSENGSSFVTDDIPF